MDDDKIGINKLDGRYQCLLLVRISTIKQLQDSDSPEHQIARGLACAKRRFGLEKEQVLIITEAWSGRKEERPSLDQALEMVQAHSISYLLVYDIDRLTRAGVSHYEIVKRRFAAVGCSLIDVKGIIQPDQNSLEGTGGAFGEDFSYDWSVFATSEKAEVMEAQAAKDEARKILSRTIPIQIKNAQLGRTIRPARYGFRNIRIIDESGKPQGSKEIVDEEAFFIRRMFEGLAAGKDSRRICDELNRLGYKSRQIRRWSKDHTHVVGMVGGIPLAPQALSSLRSRVIYAGFICEKYTHGFPVKANHKGIVSINLWNKANEQSSQLIKSDASPTGWELLDLKQQPKRRAYVMDRPDFAFKKLILCPKCGNPLKGSYSRSKTGKRFGYYHCNRGHKQVSISPQKLEILLTELLGDLTFTPEIAERFEQHIRAVWVDKVGNLNRHLSAKNKKLGELRDNADAIFEKIKLASSPLIIKRLENDYDSLMQEIKLFEAKRDEQEFSENDQNRIIKWARHMVEHLDELIINADDEGIRNAFWSLVFTATPTLEDIQNRTPEISPIVRLKGALSDHGNGLASPEEFGSNFPEEELMRWGKTFQVLESLLSPILGVVAFDESNSLPKAA